MKSMEEMRKDLAIHLYGQTKEEAQQARECINCGHEIFWARDLAERKPGCIYSHAGMKEYEISGMCEYCFDELTGVGS